MTASAARGTPTPTPMRVAEVPFAMARAAAAGTHVDEAEESAGDDVDVVDEVLEEEDWKVAVFIDMRVGFSVNPEFEEQQDVLPPQQ